MENARALQQAAVARCNYIASLATSKEEWPAQSTAKSWPCMKPANSRTIQTRFIGPIFIPKIAEIGEVQVRLFNNANRPGI